MIKEKRVGKQSRAAKVDSQSEISPVRAANLAVMDAPSAVNKHFLSIGLSRLDVEAVKKYENWIWDGVPRLLPMIQTIRLIVEITLAHYEVLKPLLLKVARALDREVINRRFSVRFSEVEIAAMKRVESDIWFNPLAIPLVNTARVFIKTALLRPGILDDRIRKDGFYFFTEGFDDTGDYYDGLITTGFGRQVTAGSALVGFSGH